MHSTLEAKFVLIEPSKV
jgi:hypothetical protein